MEKFCGFAKKIFPYVLKLFCNFLQQVTLVERQNFSGDKNLNISI